MKRQQRSTREKVFQWAKDQGMPLSLYVERNGKWDYVDYYNIAGPMAFKEDILQIPLTGGESSPLRVKLEFGNLFWEIDYTAADFSPESTVSTYTLPVESVINEQQQDISGLLRNDDENYYTQPGFDNYAEATFSLPPFNGQERSIFLHSKGWYEILIDTHGKPDWKYIMSLKKPGRFNQFVNERFLQFRQLAGK
jgi:hypothetical protein